MTNAFESALDKYLPELAEGNDPSPENGKIVQFQPAAGNNLVRTVGLMALQGMSAHQIAEVLQKPVEIILELYNDPNNQDLFRREIEAKGRYALKQLVAASAVDMILVLQGIATDTTARNSDRINAAKEVLDRGFGRPAPASKKDGSDEEGFVGSNPEATLAKLHAELEAKLAERQKRIAS